MTKCSMPSRLPAIGLFGAFALVLGASSPFPASAQTAPRSDSPPSREVVPTPPERSFLDPGPAPTQRRTPGYVAEGFLASPAYGTTERYGEKELAPKIGNR